MKTTEPFQQEPITISEYAKRARDTDRLKATPPLSLDAPVMGLVGEVGSLLAAAKKLVRSEAELIPFRETALEEFGDLLWYVSIICDRCSFNLSDLLSEAVDVPGVVTFQECDGEVAALDAVEPEDTRTALIDLNTGAAKFSIAFPEFRKDGDRTRLSQPLVRVLRTFRTAANACAFSLAEIAQENRRKIERRWPGPA